MELNSNAKVSWILI